MEGLHRHHSGRSRALVSGTEANDGLTPHLRGPLVGAAHWITPLQAVQLRLARPMAIAGTGDEKGWAGPVPTHLRHRVAMLGVELLIVRVNAQPLPVTHRELVHFTLKAGGAVDID